jgi:hypothetical protein
MTDENGRAPVVYPDTAEQVRDLVQQVNELQDKQMAWEEEREQLLRRIGSLNTELDATGVRLQAQQRMTDAMRTDISLIAEEILEEALSRDWCSEYGTFVDRVNGRTSQPWLQHCMEERTAEFVVTFTYQCRHGFAEEITESLRDVLKERSDYDLPGDASLYDIDVTLRSDG